MKFILLALTFAAAAFRLPAEGTIAFGNSRPTKVQIQYYDSDGHPASRAATQEDDLLIGVFYGPAESDVNSLVPAPGFASIGLLPGVLTNASNIFSLPGKTPNSVVSLQIRAWDAALGPEGWRYVRYQYGSMFNEYCKAGGRYYGDTPVLQVTIGLSNGPATVIWQTESGLNPNRFNPLHIRDVCTNYSPRVSLIRPTNSVTYGLGTYLILQAVASDPDGVVTQVQFFANSDLIGTSTNPPFTAIWRVGDPGGFDSQFKAVATDGKGAVGKSPSIQVRVSESLPVQPVVRIVSPKDGDMFPTRVSLIFTAEILASAGDAGPIEFLVDDVPMGRVQGDTTFTARTAPVSVTVPPLLPGEHTFSVRYLGSSGEYCTCNMAKSTIRVVRLGIRPAYLTSEGRGAFEIITSYLNSQTFIETSQNLTDWAPLTWVRPTSSPYWFYESSLVSPLSNRFYRLSVSGVTP